jgi:KDO2-lipid IV(A) lauroyltransferase
VSQVLARLGMAAVTKTLPPRAAYRVAGELSWVVLRGKTKRLRRDTAELFPDKPVRWVEEAVRDQRRHRAWSALDKVILPRLSGDEVLSHCDPDSIAATRRVCDDALAEGRGGIIYTLHYGRPVLSPLVLAYLGYPYVALRAGTNVSAFDRPLFARLQELGVEVVEATDIASGVQAMRALKRNKLFFVLVDGRITQRPTLVEFFGRRVPISLGFALLAQRTGALLAAGVTYSTDALGFRPDVTRVVLPENMSTPEELGATLMKPLEEAVRRDAGQWYGINRLFRQARRLDGDE